MSTQQARRANSLQRITEAALELFETKGYFQTTLEEIAAGAGLSKGGLLHYFRTKQDLAMRLYDDLHKDLAERFLEIMRNEPGARERIHEVARRFFEWVESSPYGARFMLGFDMAWVTEDGKPPKLESTPGRVFVQMVSEGQAAGEIKEGDPELLIRSFEMARQLALEWAAGWTEIDPDDVADDLAEMIWCAIRAEGTARGELPSGTERSDEKGGDNARRE